MHGTERTGFRFAPSPNGYLHVGHALSALTGFHMARAAGGRFIVRIEDIDLTRSRAHFADAIFEDLAWLGISWEQPVMFQSSNLDAYRQAADHLRGMGLLYPCFATRQEIAAAAAGGGVDPDGVPLYPGLYRGREAKETNTRLARGEAASWRLDMARAKVRAGRLIGERYLTIRELADDGTVSVRDAYPERWGDAVIVRKDTPASYHLSVVVDDAAQGITHVTRGADLKAATDLHRLLQVLLDLPEPVYHHHRLILDGQGRKLSKSAGDTAIRALRAQGVTPEGIRGMIDFTA